MGFGPQLVDLDGDGLDDIISGNWISQIIWFKRREDGTFAEGEPLKGKDGKVLHIDYGVYAHAVDWDGDGDLDLLAGTVDRSDAGNVYLILNEGMAGANEYGQPQKLVADGRPIVAPGGDAAPVAADWDRDGRLDLILGCGDGSVIWYRNVGSESAPAFSSFEILIPPPEVNSQRGTRAKPCVTDWNDDGELDLIVGDFGKPFDKVLSAEETQWRDEAQRQQGEFLKRWAEQFATYRELLGMTQGPAGAERWKSDLESVRAELVRLNRILGRYREQEQALQPGKQYHGRVWVYLRKVTGGPQRTVGSAGLSVDPIPVIEPTTNNPVVLSAALSPSVAARGSEVTFVIRMKTAAGWHVYAANAPEATVHPTKLALELPPGVTATGDWRFPAPESPGPGVHSVYEGDFAFRRTLLVSPTATGGRVEVKCRVSYQACDDTLCLSPQTTIVSTVLEIGEPESSAIRR